MTIEYLISEKSCDHKDPITDRQAWNGDGKCRMCGVSYHKFMESTLDLSKNKKNILLYRQSILKEYKGGIGHEFYYK